MASSRLERIGTIYTRKQSVNELFKNIKAISNEVEADYNALKDNEEKLKQLTENFMKCIRQTTTAFQNKLQSLEDIQSLQKEVEGLLVRGAMKPDDRPLWFDVYRAFPPLVEPKFARPKPELKPIRQIFYQEDIVRAKFHNKGMGLGAINMLAQSNDTQIKRLVQQYDTLKAEGTPEEELVEKSAIAVGIERKEQYEATKLKLKANPESVTAHVLAEANIKNIFKE